MNSASARVATGTFSYTRADGGGFASIDNPANGVCYTLTGGASAVTNGTNVTAELFADDSCDPNQFIDAAQSGHTLQFGVSIPHSVQFGSG